MKYPRVCRYCNKEFLAGPNAKYCCKEHRLYERIKRKRYGIVSLNQRKLYTFPSIGHPLVGGVI